MEEKHNTYEETEHIFEREEHVKDSEDKKPVQGADFSEEESANDEGLTPIDEAVAEEEAAEEQPAQDQPDDFGAAIDFEDEAPDDEDGEPLNAMPGPKGKKSGGKKPWIIVGVIAGVLLAVYLGGAYFYSSHFFANTNMNGIDASNKTVAEVQQLAKQNETDYTLTLNERDGKTETIKASAIDMKYVDDSRISQLLSEQNAWTWPSAYFGGKNSNMQEAFTYDKTKLASAIDGLTAISGAGIVNAANAYPAYSSGSITIVPEVEGNQVDKAKFTTQVEKAIATGQTTLDLDGEGCYAAPKYRSDSAEVAAAQAVMEKEIKAVVTYTFGDKQEVLDSATIGSWLAVDENMNAILNPDKVAAYVASLAEKYDTAGGAHNFTTSGGSQITVSGGTYGWRIDQDEEINQLTAVIQAGQPVTREPAYASTALSRNPANDIGNTYVEISISGQTMWLYVNGSLIISTPVVTGNVSEGNGTPTGVYYIVYKSTNATLTGPGYSSFVNFWMPFDTNHGNGIHDADGWRSSYGGSIYYSGGSHGCVNTPYSATATIYNNVSEGVPVVIY